MSTRARRSRRHFGRPAKPDPEAVAGLLMIAANLLGLTLTAWSATTGATPAAADVHTALALPDLPPAATAATPPWRNP
ncbi:hypothetical protein ACFQFR_02875 [Streptomyces goshikiensis]